MTEDRNRISMQTTSVYLRQLVSDIKADKIGIPLFQRKFVWTREQIRDLFDSILRGYPIGSFLLWERDGEWKGSLDLLTDKIDDEAKPKSYILDGRQRLTTFYGCTLDDENKPDIFKLSYNLKNQGFEYDKKCTQPYIIRVSDIFDTFLLLDKMDELRKALPLSEAQTYITRAKEFNSILQEYAVSKVTISHCDLDEATDVFSRLNSRGTDISKAFMLQALSYKKDGDKLLVPFLEGIAENLSEYGYDNIGLDDLLNACFIFDNKIFYDLNLKDMTAIMPLHHENEIRDTVNRTVEFLHNYCQVISWSLMPYAKQFQALIWFFRKYPIPDEKQKKELKKWLYYTSLTQAFQNGSMGNTRMLFTRFSEYVNGKYETAYDYSCISLSSNYDFQPSRKSVVSKLFFLTLVRNYLKVINPSSDLSYLGYYHFGGKTPEYYFVLMNDHDKIHLNKIFNTWECCDLQTLSKYSLDISMVEAYRRGNLQEFKELRRNYIEKSQLRQFAEIMPELILTAP